MMRKGPMTVLSLLIVGMLLAPALGVEADEGPSASQIDQARSPVDHAAIATAYREQASAMRDRADKHRAMLDSYQKQRGYQPAKSDVVGHCKSLIAHFDGAADAAAALAADHQRLGAESHLEK